MSPDIPSSEPSETPVSDVSEEFRRHVEALLLENNNPKRFSDQDKELLTSLSEKNKSIIRAVVEKAKQQNVIPPYAIDLTIQQFANMRKAIVSKPSSYPVTHVVVGNAVWLHLMTHDGFNKILDPVTRYIEVLAGNMAHLFAATVITDSFYDLQDRITDTNFIALVSVHEGEVVDFVAAHL